MNITEYRALQEALEWFESQDYVSIPHLRRLADAARRDLDRWQICGTCKGSGHDQSKFCPATAWVEDWQHSNGRKPTAQEVKCHLCPSCGGSGLLSNQEKSEPHPDQDPRLKELGNRMK